LISASSTNTIRQWEKEELQKASGSRGKKTAWTEEDEAVKEVLSSLPVPVISQELVVLTIPVPAPHSSLSFTALPFFLTLPLSLLGGKMRETNSQNNQLFSSFQAAA